MRKVYGILSLQLLLTVVVAAIMMGESHVRAFTVHHSLAIVLSTILPSFTFLLLLFKYQAHFPINAWLLVDLR